MSNFAFIYSEMSVEVNKKKLGPPIGNVLKPVIFFLCKLLKEKQNGYSINYLTFY